MKNCYKCYSIIKKRRVTDYPPLTHSFLHHRLTALSTSLSLRKDTILALRGYIFSPFSNYVYNNGSASAHLNRT